MKKRNLIIAGGIILGVVLISGVTYSYLSVGGKQSLANTFNSGCLSITIEEESAALNLTGAYPINDVEGLDADSYDFTIKNNCNEKTTYSISLESLNESDNNIAPEHIKVALSSDTMDNLISKLGDNPKSDGTIDESYASHQLYSGVIEGNETKTFHLKEWIDYDTTTKEGANKVYKSVINVSADTRVTGDQVSEVKTIKKGNKVEGQITGDSSDITYCTSTSKVCDPNKTIEAIENKITPELEETEDNQIVCTKIDDKKVVCSDPVNSNYCPKGATSCKSILAGRNVEEGQADFNQVDTNEHKNDQGKTNLYSAEDDFGDSYYFRGKVDDNWLKYGTDKNGNDIWWRIIRINGDGTIRLIYTGTSSDGSAPSPTGEHTNAITNQGFNLQNNDNKYVGFQYSDDNKRGHESPSNAYTQLIKWFSTNLSEEWNEENTKIDSGAGFCGDRSSSTDSHTEWTENMSESGGPGVSEITYYGAYLRLYNATKQPTLKCGTTGYKNEDYFTYKQAKRINSTANEKLTGTQSLTYPVGLITADEVVFAGGKKEENNTDYYLYTGQDYWTMSPYYFYSTSALVFRVTSSGNIYYYNVKDAINLRPVINLKSNVELSGSGTIESPYTVS